MAKHIMMTMLKALVKGKLGIGELTGKERVMLAQIGLPDRVPTMVAATNIEPANIDQNYNYVILTQDVDANLELFDKVCQRINADQLVAVGWLGFMGYGVAELGTKFEVSEDRVPYPVEYPIKGNADLDALKLPTEVAGYLKMYLDITKAAQKRYDDMMITISLDGPWDLAMLLRGDHKLPMDLRIHKDYYETDDPARREKIRKQGDPDFYTAIMEFCTQLSIRVIELAKQHGVSMIGASLIDQYAAEPIMSRDDFVKYVSPFIQRVWESQKRRINLVHPCPSPQKMKTILDTETASVKDQLFWSNYTFHTTPEGITLPEYDRPAFELAKKFKKPFFYFIHGKFIRDASEQEIDELLKRVLGLAVQIGTSLTLLLSSIPLGTDLEKVNYTLSLAEKYGRY